MQPRSLGALFGFALVSMATVGPSMAASATYQYEGPNFASASGIYSTSMSISGQLTFSSALTPNLDIFLTPGSHPGLQNFSFTDGRNTITLANTTDFGIRILTDATGAISDWRVDLQKFNRDNPSLPDNVMIIACTIGGSICGEYASTGAAGTPFSFTDLGTATNTSQRGTWSVLPETGMIIVKKETVGPDGSPLSTSENFGFEISPLDPNETFSLNTATNNPESSETFTVPAGAAYTIAETSLPPNWTLIDVTCTVDGGDPFQPDITNDSVTLDQLQDDEDVECTFKNQLTEQGKGEEKEGRPATGTIIVKNKTTFGDGKFDFRIVGSGTNQSFQLMNGGQNSFNELSTGRYTIEEIRLPPGWKLKNISCTGDDTAAESGNAVTVTLDENETITCTFTNQDTEDERMEEEVRRFIHRRVDNLLTYAPDRARILRRLQEQAPPSQKDEPLNFSGRPTGGTLLHSETTLPREGGTTVLYNNGTRPQDGLPWPDGLTAMETDDTFASGRPTPSSGNSILSLIGIQLVPLAAGQTSFKFGTNLSELRAAAAEAEAREQKKKIGDAGLSFAGQPYTNPYVTMRQGLDVWVEGHISANFPILTDFDNGYAMSLGLAFWVGADMQALMTEAGWDVAPSQGSDTWLLPVPATFVVGTDGAVKARFVDPDYRKRMAIEDLLAALKDAR